MNQLRKKVNMAAKKCRTCKEVVFEKENGSPNGYYCVHPRSLKNEPRLICKLKKHSDEMVLKTSPQWCPLKYGEVICS